MEKFKEIEPEPEETPAETNIERGGLDRLEKELEKSIKERPPAEAVVNATQKSEAGPEQKKDLEKPAPKKEARPNELRKVALEIGYYDPDVWKALKKQSQQVYEKTLLEKSGNLTKRYLAGTATPEEKLLLDELKIHNQSELTDILFEEAKGDFLDRIGTRIMGKYGLWEWDAKKYKDRIGNYGGYVMPARVAEFWLVCSNPQKLKDIIKIRRFGYLYSQMTKAMPSIESTIKERLEKIVKLKKRISEGDAEEIEKTIKELQTEKEITSKLMGSLEGIFGRSRFTKFMDYFRLPDERLGELNIFEQLKKDFKRAIESKGEHYNPEIAQEEKRKKLEKY